MRTFILTFSYLFLVPGLLWSENTYSKPIQINKCEQLGHKFDTKKYEKKSYLIDLDKSIVQRINIITKEEYDRRKKEYDNPATILKPLLEKIEIIDYKIEYFDKRFVKANHKINSSMNKDTLLLTAVLEIDLAEKIVTSGFKEQAVAPIIFKCY